MGDTQEDDGQAEEQYTSQHTVSEDGIILVTTLNKNGEIIGENLVGNVEDLPVQEEYIDDQGRVVSQVQDGAGNVYEQVLDDEGNMIEVRSA